MINNKKKILFIVSNMETGGVSKSMTSLLNTIDTKRYDVSLLLISPHGALMSLLPDNITIITDPTLCYLSQRFSGFVNLIRYGQPMIALGHLLRLALSLVSKSMAGRLLSRLMPAIDGEYDTIVDYNGQQQLYYMVDKLHGKKKVTFFHSDYAKWPYYYKADRLYYPRVDRIFTISNECVASLKRYFPDCADKIGMMENISSRSLIRTMSQKELTITKLRDFTLATIGHISYNKGIDIAIEAAARLKAEGHRFLWLFIGKVVEQKYIDEIKQRELEDSMMMVGVTPNPYPYLAAADIVVHPSRFEGKSVALDEAKILCKPIVVTNFSTVNDQFTNYVNATICKMSGESVANAIEELVKNPQLRRNYIGYLQQHITDNTSEINKLYQIFDNE